MTKHELFQSFFSSNTEKEMDQALVRAETDKNIALTWHPLGGNDNNFGVIENQQSSPIAALIEKVTNSIDAILLKKCIECGIDPKSDASPRSMEEAIKLFFLREQPSWHLGEFRQKQAEEIQILADGPKFNTSLTIYDNGEGQHPEDFERTFLSLLRGNKNEIHFVQGKYNMGGTGALVFCGEKRYQLIGSRRFDKKGDFGFTLIRRHPLTPTEAHTKKNTWYEYLKIDSEIPKFSIETLELKLRGRQFITGTIVKLINYDLPSGSRSVISRDLNQSINEFLFDPALPIYTIDREERYPDDKNLSRELFGLKRRLEQDESKYVEQHFSVEDNHQEIGKTKVTCYVFRNKIEGKDVKETRASIEREFFKNDMAVLFALNGQVHGHYTNEFITRTLKMPLLKNHLLIHVDCTHMNLDFRNELFMASRDRLKEGEKSRQLRALVGAMLEKSKLKEIYKKRKDSITIGAGDTGDLLRSLSKTLPINSDLLNLIKETFKLELNKPNPGTSSKGKNSKGSEVESNKEAPTDGPDNPKPPKPTFVGKRFPSFFKLKTQGSESHPAAQIPIGGKRAIKFYTDVEDQYFDRTEDPGELRLSLLNFKPNETSGGNQAGDPKELSELFNVTSSSPDSGEIRVSFNPTKKLKVDDLIEVKAILDGPGVELEQCFWVKVLEKEPPQPKPQKEVENKQDSIGLPPYFLLYQEPHEGFQTWDDFSNNVGLPMDYGVVMHPVVSGDKLEAIYINMDSHVLKDNRAKLKNITESQIEVSEKKYITSVYFHTLFLYTIAKKKHFSVRQDDKDVGLDDFLKDVFAAHYSEFLLNFGMEQLMATLEV